MKKYIIIAFFILLNISVYSQSTNIKLDSFISYDYSYFTDTIRPEAKTTYLYNWKQLLTKETLFDWDNGYFEMKRKFQYYYNNIGNMDSSIWYFWYFNKWNQRKKWSFTQNKKSQLEKEKCFEWNDTLYFWDSSEVYLYSYDNYNHLILKKCYGYDFYHENWNSYMEYHWFYNSSSCLTEYAEKWWCNKTSSLEWHSREEYKYHDEKKIRKNQYDWDDNKKQIFLDKIYLYNYNLFDSLKEITTYQLSDTDTSLYRRFEYNYGNHHYIRKQYEYDWNSYDNNWVLDSEFSYEFDYKTGLLFKKEGFNGSGLGIYKKVYKYTNENKIQTALEHDWDRDNKIWVKYNKTEYTYNQDGKLILEERFEWNSYYKYWSIRYRCEYYYSAFSSITKNTKQPNILLYPNPADERIIIDYDKLQEIDRIIITNVKGQIVKIVTKLNSNFIDIAELKSGMYFCT
ncbi:MAG: T9SS type A sorting domain-containing protein, partial [Bacteroidota bacterium]|nr:T9SS type A sorting domain-containing protein [Bacteroidota bacterium]